MINSPNETPRFLIDAVRRHCAERGIALDVRADGWLLLLDRDNQRQNNQRHVIFGYDLGLNSAVAHRIASDKAATAEMLALSGVACVPHAFFLAPLGSDLRPSRAPMLKLLDAHPEGLVVKPNEGTSGRLVFRAESRLTLDHAVDSIFAISANIAIAPFLDIEDEIRVIVLDGTAQLVYAKQRAAVTGDGAQTLRELAIAATPPEQHAELIDNLRNETGDDGLDAIVPAGHRHLLNWRHNLEFGAGPVLLEDGETRETCVALAIAAARAIGIRFASVDVIKAKHRWQVLEINSGVVMEQLGKQHPELVHATYAAALDKVFG